MNETQYTTWKENLKNTQFHEEWLRVRALIIKMIIDNVKDEVIIKYLEDKADIDDPESALYKAKKWASIPDLTKFDSIKDYYAGLRYVRNTLKMPASLNELETWTPPGELTMDYEQVNKQVEPEKLEEGVPTQDEPTDTKETLHIISESQQNAIDKIKDAYDTLSLMEGINSPIKPRTNCMIAGPSGSGKSFTARHFAETENIPFFSTTVSTWNIMGSKSEAQHSTTVTIADYVLNNESGIIFLDEIDKLNHDSNWNQNLRLEIHNLLDGSVENSALEGLEKKHNQQYDEAVLDEINYKLKNSFLIIAGGTWQSVWESKGKSTIGFGEEEQEPTFILNKGLLTKSITEELLQRFQKDLIIINPLTEKDYLELAEKFSNAITSDDETSTTFLQESYIKFVKADIKLAVQNLSGMRYLEDCLTKAIKEYKDYACVTKEQKE